MTAESLASRYRPPTKDEWMDIYRLCLERAQEELALPPREAAIWASQEADRLLYGGAR